MRNHIVVAVTFFALAAASQSAWADEEAQIDIRGTQSGQSNLKAPLGGRVSDSGEPVDFMQAIVNDVPQGPFSISDGAFSFKTPKATSVDLSYYPPAYTNFYAAGGGSLTLTGSIFGLPDGSPLFTATFAPEIPPPYGAVTSAFVDPTVDLVAFAGLLTITWTNPELLNALGIGDFPGDGDGSISVTRYRNGDTGSLGTLTGFTLQLDGPVATPEPATAFLLGAGLLGIMGRRRTANRAKPSLYLPRFLGSVTCQRARHHPGAGGNVGAP